MSGKKKVSFLSLGCFRNRYDSEIAAARITAGGKTILLPEEISKRNKCDILAVNTCGFIEPAKVESIQAINDALNLKKEKKVKKVYVFGCLVQRYQKQLQKYFPEVDSWWGVEVFSKNYRGRLRESSPVDFLKISEGCVNNCSYCVIPQIKGPLRSRPASEVLKEVEELERSGVRELNLVGQDITGWGKDLGSRQGLLFLLKKILHKTKRIKWIRLIYTHPSHVTDELIELIAEEKKICDYIDLPIQHINKRILKLMNRKTSPEEIEALIKKIREKIPGCAIRTSVITGFPTETEAEFEELLRFIKKAKFEKLGVFLYSREEKTKAAAFSGQVHSMTKKRRRRQIMEAQQKISAELLERFVGKKIDVLITGKEKGCFLARSQYDAPEVDGLVFIKRRGLKMGRFYKAEVTDSLEYDLVAK